MAEYQGILFIGDTHLASRTLDFRKDDYPRESLKDFCWCLDYARKKKLLPALLGDIFHWPRDNANWLLGELLSFLQDREVVCIYGNHDCQENRLTENDSLMVLIQAGALRLLSPTTPWRGTMNGQAVCLGGTSWGQDSPDTIERDSPKELVFWMTHHDWLLPGYENETGPLGKLETRVLRGANLVVNGHIHRQLPEHQFETTRWFNPGSVARVSRSDATRMHKPSLLRVDISKKNWSLEMVPIPHKPYKEIFHEVITDQEGMPLFENTSAFIHGLAELQARRTDTGAGLLAFLENNLHQFSPAVGTEIRSLADEVVHAQPG
ncbi:MAG: metallophosphoesterase family protein [Gemmatales bacterium]